MRIKGTHHVALITARFAELCAFYVETLGLPIVGGFPGHNIVFLGAGGTTIELIEEEVSESAAGSRGWNHLALEVDDVDAAYRELARQGVPFTSLPEDFPSEAPKLRIAFLQDPDGNLVELVQPLVTGFLAL
jgi:catechol 2,3-dioxygenase-like lactoylglutathione lyase family enzyme